MRKRLPRLARPAAIVPGPFPGIGQMKGDRRIPEAALSAFEAREIVADPDARREPLRKPLGLFRLDQALSATPRD
ncbi:hypothetical protein [Dongia rigui]|uniref:Uncharacterized protein n=1 Tax=Dongia rigui TaxID=940149 RepID=A0ABU5E1Y4_9PROT|nr:hypothetical protein [Dongia rigui]MDY0872821.1 hypothetical protein [Dongia rigui]